MKQVLQNLQSGVTEVAEVPCPTAGRGQLLIRSRRTLVSAGTERMLVDFGRAGLLEKARQQPDKVRMVLEKVRTDGLLPTLDAVRNKLEQPLQMGYCNAGEVLEVGAGVQGFAVGDRVVCNGRHAEVVAVPVNLCARIPDHVDDESAAFTVLGAIALQGIRLVQPTLGESVVVTGLGLIGLLTVQLLRAHGCRVLALDFDRAKLDLAQRCGAEVVDLAADADPIAAAQEFSRQRGVDAVIITASTSSSEPVHQAALMCRKRGRIVLVGVTGLELSRADFYEKELTFQVSCSYGPGRYDPAYEEKGQDYPFGFVRWTEQRNFEAVLDMMAARQIATTELVTHRFPIADAARAYDLIASSEPSLAVLILYDDRASGETLQQRSIAVGPQSQPATQAATIGFVGSGNYATAVLAPAFRDAGARLRTVASAGGVSSLHVARKLGFEQATTDHGRILADPSIDAVVIATRHDSHAAFVLEARAAGKHVFVEKPLCLDLQQLAAVEAAYGAGAPLLMVGFNRRFAPHVQKMRSLLEATPEPKAIVATINAGAILGTHWTQDPAVGGGRILGEACHFVDLLRFLVGHSIAEWRIAPMRGAQRDTAVISLTFADGSVGAINYLANGSKAFAKERIEVFVGGRILQLDNFRRLQGYGWPGFRKLRLWRQDKGQRACARAFVEAVRTSAHAPIPLEQILEVARVSIELARSSR